MRSNLYEDKFDKFIDNRIETEEVSRQDAKRKETRYAKYSKQFSSNGN